MKKLFRTAVSILFGVALFFVPISIMLYSALEIEKLSQRWLHPPAVVLAVLAGVLLFVTTTYISTHLVVRLFRSPQRQSNEASK
jgi:cytochrome c biogenesis protein CcdA